MFDLNYDMFSKIAHYGNVAWKGFFSEEELSENIEVYYEEYLYSKKHNELSPILVCLMNLLIDDMGDLRIEDPIIIDFELIVDNFINHNF